MTITITPDSPAVGAMCTARVQYTRPVPPVPNDMHIQAKHDDGTWTPVTGYDVIPAGMNPVAGFDVRFSSGSPTVGGPGERDFRVLWTLDGDQLGAPDETTVLLGPSPAPPPAPGPGILDTILEILKFPFLPVTLPWCIICRAIGANNPSCVLACSLVPDVIRRALGLR